jgi:hypothetical protein
MRSNDREAVRRLRLLHMFHGTLDVLRRDVFNPERVHAE